MFSKIIPVVLVLCACANNSNHQEATTDSARNSVHDLHVNTYTDNVLANADTDPLQGMHQAMTHMMEQVQQFKPTGNADHDFASLMRLHHHSAVQMAEAHLHGAQDSSLRNISQQIIKDQKREMDQFDQFLQQNQSLAGNSGYGKQAIGMMTHEADMQGGSADVVYAKMMIPHHQDGVKMAEAYLKEGKDEGLRSVALDIVRTQPREVAQLQAWLQQQPQ